MAVSTGMLNLSKVSAAALQSNTTYWQGIALGADAQLQIIHHDKQQAKQLVKLAIAEVKRLESIFSLYQPDSAINQLNKNGFLSQPPSDLKRLLSESNYYSNLTNGMFDPSVQPIWQLYAKDNGKISRAKLQAVINKVNYRAIDVNSDLIKFNLPDMAITLNGIAQGYITDRVAELLHANGLQRALIDMGEIRSLGAKTKNEPWLAGIARPSAPDQVLTVVELDNKALATSGAYGTQINKFNGISHLFNPHTGLAKPFWDSVTVKANTATMADALSTAFSMLKQPQIQAIVDTLPIEVWLVKNGSNEILNLV